MTAAGGNVALASKYMDGAVQGLNIAVASNTTLTISAGSSIDSTNQSNIILPTVATLNAAVVGVNGIDTGVFQASKTYYVYNISSSVGAETPGTIMSLSSTSPLMPSGKKYDVFKLIGFAFSDGSIHFLPVTQLGNGNFRRYLFDNAISVLSGGTSATLAAIDLSAAVPVLDGLGVLINVDFTPATASDNVSFFSGTSSATLGFHIAGSVAAKVNSGQGYVLSKIASSVPAIKYINSAASGSASAWVQGFDHFI